MKITNRQMLETAILCFLLLIFVFFTLPAWFPKFQPYQYLEKKWEIYKLEQKIAKEIKNEETIQRLILESKLHILESKVHTKQNSPPLPCINIGMMLDCPSQKIRCVTLGNITNCESY
jgi:hypothetical protein